jgi:hypothetical protein
VAAEFERRRVGADSVLMAGAGEEGPQLEGRHQDVANYLVHHAHAFDANLVGGFPLADDLFRHTVSSLVSVGFPRKLRLFLP